MGSRGRYVVAAIAVSVALFLTYTGRHVDSSRATSADAGTSHDEALADAFANRASELQVEGTGTVSRILPDDNNGSRHQRFVVRLSSGQTLLIAHNIDIAPRVSPLQPGDTVTFRGDYEWSAQGGIVHWTHRDPSGRHRAGFIRRSGHTE